MYTVTIVKTIFDAPSAKQSTKMATLTKEIELPFPPSLEIELSLGAVGSTRIAKINWIHGSKKFLCELVNDFPRHRDGRTLEFERLLDLASNDGWKLMSIDDVDPDFIED